MKYLITFTFLLAFNHLVCFSQDDKWKVAPSGSCQTLGYTVTYNEYVYRCICDDPQIKPPNRCPGAQWRQIDVPQHVKDALKRNANKPVDQPKYATSEFNDPKDDTPLNFGKGSGGKEYTINAGGNSANLEVGHYSYSGPWKGEDGIMLNVTLKAYNLKGEKLNIITYFYADNKHLKADGNKFDETGTNNLIVAEPYTPSEDAIELRNFRLFIPSKAVSEAIDRAKLSFPRWITHKVVVKDSNGNVVGESAEADNWRK